MKYLPFFYSQSSFLRKNYWDNRAYDIDQKWGKASADYGIVRGVIEKVKPSRILDFGCGSGRLFALYSQLLVAEVVAQDISAKALAIARQRNTSPGIKLLNTDILRLDYPAAYFDLIISHQVLQHIPPGRIDAVVKKIAGMSRWIYLNETHALEGKPVNFYLFRYNYPELLAGYGFDLVEKGVIDSQTWFLFAKARS